MPDGSSTLRFRHPLEEHNLSEAIFAEVRSLLGERHLLLKSGTVVDATMISAPSSTKNREGKRDPEMWQTKKGKNWHHGMKLHLGTDPKGLVHTVRVTNVAEADINPLPELTHGGENVLYGDQAYWLWRTGKPTRSRASATG